jgi:hypothetical protein
LKLIVRICIHLEKNKTTPRALKLPIYEVFIILKDVTMTWQKWGSKQALEKRKTSLSLMEVYKNCYLTGVATVLPRTA